MNRCEECSRLDSDIDAVLNQLVELTSAQLDAFRAKNHTVVTRLDRELEHAVGRKERAFGAQREHARQHGKSIYEESESKHESST